MKLQSYHLLAIWCIQTCFVGFYRLEREKQYEKEEWLKRVHKKNFKFTVLIDFVFYVSVTFVLLKVHHAFQNSLFAPALVPEPTRKCTGSDSIRNDREMNQEVVMDLTVVKPNRGTRRKTRF